MNIHNALDTRVKSPDNSSDTFTTILKGDTMDATTTTPIIRYEHGAIKQLDDAIIVEYTLQVVINGEPFVRLICSPIYLEELITGFLYSERIILLLSDICNIAIDEEKGIASVTVSDEASARLAATKNRMRTITTALGKQESVTYALPVLKNDDTAERGIFTKDMILDWVRDFATMSDIFQKTGAVHSSALYNETGRIAFFEDIGRHNAIDKIIGFVLRNGLSFERSAIITSGRIPREMVLKAVHCKLPVLVSVAATTDKAIETARAANLTLIGFVRGRKMNIYASPERVV